LLWMRSQGIRFAPMYSRQAFKHEGKFVFWGGLALEAWGGGPGLVEGLFKAAEERQIQVAYEARGEKKLIADDDGVHGVIAKVEGQNHEIAAKAGDPRLRRLRGQCRDAHPLSRPPAGTWPRCAAPGSTPVRASRWRSTSVRCPTGTGRAAMPSAGTTTRPNSATSRSGDNFQKHSYPFAIMVNADGVRFCDEGADFRNYTYAKYGRLILEQPHQFAWQIFDQQTVHLQRDEYRIRQVTRSPPTRSRLWPTRWPNTRRSISRNSSKPCARTTPRCSATFPTIQRSRTAGTTRGLAIDKTNWAMPLEKPPFEAYCTTCGVTFTFGGLRIDTDGRVLDTAQKPIPGLYAAGELVGGLFYFNYPGGTGLVSGSVFGKIAGPAPERRCSSAEPGP